MQQKLLLLLIFATIFLFGFEQNETEESKIIMIINQLVDSINEKDAESLIHVLKDNFIEETYGNKEYIENNIHKFGNITSFYIYNTSVKSYYAITNYYLNYEDPSAGWRSDFMGIIILDKVNNDWKIHSITQEEVNYNHGTN